MEETKVHNSKFGYTTVPKKADELEVAYTVYSRWELNEPIEKAYSWWIKYDKLHVVWRQGEGYVEYSPVSEARNSDFKHPDENGIFLNGEPVEEKLEE